MLVSAARRAALRLIRRRRFRLRAARRRGFRLNGGWLTPGRTAPFAGGLTDGLVTFGGFDVAGLAIGCVGLPGLGCGRPLQEVGIPAGCSVPMVADCPDGFPELVADCA